MYSSEIKHGDITVVKRHHIISALNNEEQAFRYFAQTGLQRSFVDLGRLTPAAKNVLREVLVMRPVLQDLENEGIRLCYENGWLHSEPLNFMTTRVLCVFPSRLHAK